MCSNKMLQKGIIYNDMIKYLISGTLPENLSAQDQEKLISKSSQYKVSDGMLFDISEGQPGKLVITDSGEKMEVMKSSHVEGHQHLSYNNTLQRVSGRYTWEGLVGDVQEYVSSCSHCAQRTIPITVDPSQRNAVWKMVEVEILGPFSLQCDTCVLQITDLTSKWISCLPIFSNTARVISQTLINFLSRMGLPTVIRFTNLDDHHSILITDELESCLREFFKTAESVTALVKPDEAPQPSSPQVYIHRVLEDDLFTFKDAEALKTFVEESTKDLVDTLCFYIVVGEESLLEMDLQEWHSSMITNFIKRNPTDWADRIEYFSTAIRSYLPNSRFAKAPNYLMFVRNLDIFKHTSKNAFLGNEEFVALENKRMEQPMQASDEDSANDDVNLYIDSSYNTDVPMADETSTSKTRPHVVCLKKNYGDDMRELTPFLKKKSHISNRMPCSICSDVFFISHDLMEEHLKFHLEGTDSFKCPYCDKMASTWGAIYIHFCNHDESIPIIGTEEDPTENYLSCPYCAKEFRARSRMLRHLKRLHLGQKNYDCDICSREFEERRELVKHMEVHQHESHLYKCRDCSFHTQLLANFQEHLSMHDSGDHYCPICQKSFPLRSALTCHMSTLHGIVNAEDLKPKLEARGSGGSLLKCPQCTFKARARHTLKLHIKRIHNKTFECDYCNKTMVGESVYQRHLDRYHGEEHLLPCPQCDFKASTAKTLSEHVKYQHDPDIPKLTCPYCQLSFRTLPLLKDHIPTHTGAEIYTCKVCLYKYKYRSNAYRHAKQKHPEVALKDAIERAEIDRNGMPLSRDGSGAVEDIPSQFGPSDSNMLLGSDVTVSSDNLIVGEPQDEVKPDVTNVKNPVVTLDPKTGTVMYDGQALTVDGNIVQFVNEDGTPMASFEGSDQGMELLLVALENNGMATPISSAS